MRVNNYSVEETSKKLNINLKTVYNNYSTSLSAIRAYLANNHPDIVEQIEKKATVNKAYSIDVLIFFFFMYNH